MKDSFAKSTDRPLALTAAYCLKGSRPLTYLGKFPGPTGQNTLSIRALYMQDMSVRGLENSHNVSVGDELT